MKSKLFSNGNIAMRDYQESVTIGQTDAHTDRRRTKWSLCAAMLRRRHKNDECFLTYSYHHMFYRVYTVRSIPCLYEVSLLAATKMLNKESLSTSLSAFLIRRLCFLITIEKMFNVFHFGNKFAYSNMKNLDKNVFGTDLSSSKLWLATFLLQQGDFHGSLSGRHISAYELCVCLRMTTFCHSLSYADARRQHVGRWLSERSEHVVIRTRTLELVAYAEKFYACTKILCVCLRTARTQRARYAHAMRTFRASAAR